MKEYGARVVVIGSGSGGAPVACRLAEAGHDVLLLEEGGWYQAPDFTQREGAMLDRLYRDRGAQSPADFSIRVLQGRCVGGSTVINMGDVVPMTAEVLEHWRSHFAFPITAADLQEPEQRALARIQARQIPETEVNRNGQLLLSGAQKLGWKNGILRDNRFGCVGAGTCLLGCTFNAKKSTLLNYIPDGVAAGLRLYSGARVERIERRGNRAHAVHGVWMKESREGIAGEKFRIRAEFVVIAAGAMHSPLILQRSGIDLPQLGRNLSLQPQAMVAAVFPEAIRAFRGIPQSAYMDQYLQLTSEQGLGGFVLESVMSGPAQAAAFSAGIGSELRTQMKLYDHLAACLVLTPDRPTGTVQPWVANRPRIQYSFSVDVRQRIWQGMVAAGEVYFAAGASLVMLMQQGARSIGSLGELRRIATTQQFQPILTPTISAHPQGTCRMGDQPGQAVVDADFAVFGSTGIYVCDTSLFPTSASTHTMVPTLTMAEYCADRLLAAL